MPTACQKVISLRPKTAGTVRFQIQRKMRTKTTNPISTAAMLRQSSSQLGPWVSPVDAPVRAAICRSPKFPARAELLAAPGRSRQA